MIIDDEIRKKINQIRPEPLLSITVVVFEIYTNFQTFKKTDFEGF